MQDSLCSRTPFGPTLAMQSGRCLEPNEEKGRTLHVHIMYMYMNDSCVAPVLLTLWLKKPGPKLVGGFNSIQKY